MRDVDWDVDWKVDKMLQECKEHQSPSTSLIVNILISMRYKDAKVQVNLVDAYYLIDLNNRSLIVFFIRELFNGVYISDYISDNDFKELVDIYKIKL